MFAEPTSNSTSPGRSSCAPLKAGGGSGASAGGSAAGGGGGGGGGAGGGGAAAISACPAHPADAQDAPTRSAARITVEALFFRMVSPGFAGQQPQADGQ